LDIQGNLVFAADATFGLSYTPATFDGDLTNPTLIIPIGSLSFNNNTISVNNAGGTALGIGTYRLIEVTGGTINGTPNASVTVTGDGLASGNIASLAVSGGYINLVVSEDTSTSNAALQSEKLAVFVNDGNQLVINAPEKSNYAVYSALGQLIQSGIVNADNQISSFKLSAGVYLVKVNNTSKRVIVNQ
jgi:hypothetical protein